MRAFIAVSGAEVAEVGALVVVTWSGRGAGVEVGCHVWKGGHADMGEVAVEVVMEGMIGVGYSCWVEVCGEGAFADMGRDDDGSFFGGGGARGYAV